MGYFHPSMLVDPFKNPNNHDAVLIDRALYRAMAKLYELENRTVKKLQNIITIYCA